MDNESQRILIDTLPTTPSPIWQKYFEYLRQIQYKKITSTSDGDLLKLKTKIQTIDELETNIINIIKTKKIGT